ncbi:jg25817, partial [Pararge aegeria aegeria]
GVPRQIKLEWAVWRRRYIATQGPTPATLDAFWRMIWQHRVHTLVMITNLVERGRRKCDMYWPAGGRGSSADFGGIHVTLLYEDVRAAYTVRHLRVRGKPQPVSAGAVTTPQ